MKKPRPKPIPKPDNGQILKDLDGPLVFRLSLALYICGILTIFYYPFVMPSFWLASYMT